MTARPSTDAEPRATDVALRRLGLVCVLVNACARLITTTDPLPGWSLDPLTNLAPQNGVGPALSISLAALPLLGLALVLLAEGRASGHHGRHGLALLLGAIALPAVAWHGWFGPTASVANASVLASWTAAIAGGLAAFIACRHAAERALVVACCIGLAGPLAARAAVQVYVEHPELLAQFRADREQFLAGQGFSPGSAMARAFERRLSQPDASAWLAMSNVYASIMIGCAVAFTGAAVAVFRRRLWATGARPDLYRALGVAAGAALALGGFVIAVPAGGVVSKGAAAALALGLAILAAALLRHRLPTPLRSALCSRAFGLVLIAAALAAVVLRGQFGERLGELSLLFRWFYMQAAVAIFGERPLLGVGPDGFQDAYLIHKNPLSPEEVASPHSLFLDYLSTLGLFGLGWIALVLLLASRLGPQLGPQLAPPPDAPSPDTRAEAEPETSPPYRSLLAVVLFAALIHFWREALPLARAAPDAFSLLMIDGVTRLLGYALLWLGLAAAVLGIAGDRALRAGLAAAALALLVHAQIELTGADPSSAAWLFALLGAAAATGPVASLEQPPRPRRFAAAAAAVPAALALALAAAALPVWSWQARLRAAAGSVAESTALTARARAIATGNARENPADFLLQLESLVGGAVPPTDEGVDRALTEIRFRRVAAAADDLERLARAESPSSAAVAHTVLGLRATEAGLARQLGRDPSEPAGELLALARWAADRWPADSRAHRDLARALAQAAGPPEPPAPPSPEELDALRRAAELDPHSPELARDLALRTRDAGLMEEARRWAARAIEAHRQTRLDPLAGLADDQVQTLRELVGSP